ncbi:MAG TPA: hypothetical protein VHE14_08185, partial [Solirubrobacteraceae bacterium]|nr:hypothetical protein [Solirubrobacteraceae bacterium]
MLIAPTRAGAAGTAGSTPRPLTAAGAARADPNALAVPPSLDQSPPQHVLSARHALAIADAVPKVRAARRRHAPTTRQAFEKGTDRWQVSYYDARRHEIAQVTILDRNGRVLEAWDGFQVAWTMARGYEGAFGRKVDALYVWLPLCVLFVLPFIDPRRLWRLLHLDLLVLLGFSVSLAFF